MFSSDLQGLSSNAQHLAQLTRVIADNKMATQTASQASGSAAVVAQEPQYTDRGRMEYLFLTESELYPEEDVVQSVLDTLGENRVTKPWQLAKLPETVLERWSPRDTSLQEYLLVTSIRDMLQQAQQAQQKPPEAAASNNTEAYSLVAKAINAFTTECEKARKQRKRGKSSDSEDELDKQYDCTRSLEKYGLRNIPNTHTWLRRRTWRSGQRRLQLASKLGNPFSFRSQ